MTLLPDTARPSTGAPRFADLGRHGCATALVTADETLTYAELAQRVGHVAQQLGPTRRLVLVEAANTVEAVVADLAALTADCPVLLAPPTAAGPLTVAYDPDVLLTSATGWLPQERRPGTAHQLHDDLALLLSTSGSTGSPKLVRLSHSNLQANAEAVAAALALRPTDVAATTLPLGYCYGLSVLHSHLEQGAGLLLTDLSVVDPCFWQLVRTAGATSFAGVPHTFDLLDRAGFAELDLPSLRTVTQAGGRLAPDKVRRFAQLGQRRGWDLVVMYGQTEATARMAVLPAGLAAEHPTSIGRPVPGGAFELEPVPECDEPGTGELVYVGPNVMMGYATSPSDLALGAGPERLRTGDLARRTGDGLYEVVGRRSRMAKLFGLRIDLQRVEGQLGERGVEAVCVGTDDEFVVVTTAGLDLRRTVAELTGLPRRCVRAVVVEQLPRLGNGKLDLRQAAVLAAPPVAAAPQPTAGADVAGLCALLAEVLDVPEVRPDDTFVGLGGDSLSYVEASVRLEPLVGVLPPDWHVTPVRELARQEAPPARSGRLLETGVALRAAGIVAVVGSHTELVTLLGGAHVMLAVAGYNLARFCLSAASPWRSLLRAARGVAVPSVVAIADAAVLTDRYTAVNVLLLNGVLGPREWGPTWHFWFVEVLVYLTLGAAALLAVPAVRRLERRRPWGFALGLVAVGAASRFAPGWLPTGPDRIHTAHVVLWLFALGWAAAGAGTTGRRLLLTAVVLLTVPGFFGDPQRDALVVAGVSALVWVRAVRVPAAVAVPVATLAAASLHVYVTHWLVYPDLEAHSPLGATCASLAVGLLYQRLHLRVRALRPWAAVRSGPVAAPAT